MLLSGCGVLIAGKKWAEGDGQPKRSVLRAGQTFMGASAVSTEQRDVQFLAAGKKIKT